MLAFCFLKPTANTIFATALKEPIEQMLYIFRRDDACTGGHLNRRGELARGSSYDISYADAFIRQLMRLMRNCALHDLCLDRASRRQLWQYIMRYALSYRITINTSLLI